MACGAFKVRSHRALKSFKEGTEPEIEEDFNKLSPEDKAKFMKEHQTKFGEHLKMAIQQRVKVVKKEEILQTALGKGHMLDEADLKTKYASKPDQLTAILKMH